MERGALASHVSGAKLMKARLHGVKPADEERLEQLQQSSSTGPDVYGMAQPNCLTRRKLAKGLLSKLENTPFSRWMTRAL